MIKRAAKGPIKEIEYWIIELTKDADKLKNIFQSFGNSRELLDLVYNTAL